MTDDDLTRLRDEVAGVLAEIRARRDGNLQPLSYYHRWADVEADALLPLLARKIAEARGEAWDEGYVAADFAVHQGIANPCAVVDRGNPYRTAPAESTGPEGER